MPTLTLDAQTFASLSAAMNAALAVPSEFPADPGAAPFPSPDNSVITCVGGHVGSPNSYPAGVNPYVKDAQGAVWQFEIENGAPVLSSQAAGQSYAPGQDYYFTINGQRAFGAVELLVREGEVYFMLGNGKWAVAGAQDSPAAGVSVISAPPAPASAAPTTGGGISAPKMPADPTPSPIAPGSSGNTVMAGPGQTYTTLAAAIAAAKPGDTVKLAAGTYAESVLVDRPLVIDGQGAATLDGSSFTTYVRQKGGIVVAADAVIQNLHITGFGMKETVSQLTSGVRTDTGCGYLTLNNVQIDNCQDGVGSGGIACDITLNGCSLSKCGLGDGQSHNLYVSTATVRLKIMNTTSTQPNGGHAIKSRAAATVIVGGEFDGAGSSIIDLPDGTTLPFSISGATLNKGATDPNHLILTYAVESTSNGTAGGTVAACTINAACESPGVLTQVGAIAFTANTLTGNPVTASGSGTVTGL